MEILLFTKRFCFLLLLASTIMWSSFSHTYCPDGNLTVKREYLDSPLVLIGRVISEQETKATKNWLDGTTYAVEINEVLGGSQQRRIRLFSEDSTSRFPMEVGKQYLMFVYPQSGRFAIDNCGNSGILAERVLEVREIRSLRSIR